MLNVVGGFLDVVIKVFNKCVKEKKVELKLIVLEKVENENIY